MANEIWTDLVHAYLGEYGATHLDVIDVGGPSAFSKEFKNPLWNYQSLNTKTDTEAICINDSPYSWDQIETNSVDVVVSKDTLEHIPFFWATFFEIGRVMKNGGLAMIHIPSTAPEHPGQEPPGYRENKYFDCWRFFNEMGLKTMMFELAATR